MLSIHVGKQRKILFILPQLVNFVTLYLIIFIFLCIIFFAADVNLSYGTETGPVSSNFTFYILKNGQEPLVWEGALFFY